MKELHTEKEFKKLLGSMSTIEECREHNDDDDDDNDDDNDNDNALASTTATESK